MVFPKFPGSQRLILSSGGRRERFGASEQTWGASQGASNGVSQPYGDRGFGSLKRVFGSHPNHQISDFAGGLWSSQQLNCWASWGIFS